MRRVRGRRAVTATALLAPVLAAMIQGGASRAHAAEPPPPLLSTDTSPADVASGYGSGVFGAWQVDAFGLPFYRYDVDEQSDPRARQPELAGKTDAWSQVGNDHLVANAYNHGWMQLWSQDRLSQWMNRYDAANRHYAGGYGYLNVDGRVMSTLYDDRPAGAVTERDFGVGYYRRTLRSGGTAVAEQVYAPYGDDPVLLHDVRLRNTSAAVQHVSWFEYWDVNPYEQGSHLSRGIAAPVWNAAQQTLTVAQTPHGADVDPLSIFGAALSGGTSGYETTTAAFFGSGTRAAPAAVAAGHLGGGIAAPVPDPTEGGTMMALQNTLDLAPGATATLRYVYGYAHPQRVGALVAKYRGVADAFATSERSWSAALPRASYDTAHVWLARELTWDAYLLRSASVYEEGCGHHTVTQGGYYQYDLGANLGYRSWLHYLLPITYMDPSLAREILLYSVGLQPQGVNQLPYGMIGLCTRFDLGTSDDLDFWLLLAASEYGLATRDLGFFDTPVHFYMLPTSASIWEHLKLSFQHQESLKGPHGGYLSETTGDWSDFSPEFLKMTESMLVTAQTAYAYPRLAALADLRGDHVFAQTLRAAADTNLATLRREWTGQGWYSRGYTATVQLGRGVIFEEPQPWALLAGAATPAQAATLAANIRRYLDGVGAPAVVHGPALAGSSIGPARDDPGISETSSPDVSAGGNNAIWPGGTWFDPNGWLTWAYAELDGSLAGARELAFSEYMRNSLANHATVWPAHWDGITSVDDTCQGYFDKHPEQCGGVLNETNYEGQITEQPTWMVMDAIRLAGITPTQRGYSIAPHLAFTSYSLRLPQVGVSVEPSRMRGYVTPVGAGTLLMSVDVPDTVDLNTVTTWSAGSVVSNETAGHELRFLLPASAGVAADWAVTWGAAAPLATSAAAALPGTARPLPTGAVLFAPAAVIAVAGVIGSARRRRSRRRHAAYAEAAAGAQRTG